MSAFSEKLRDVISHSGVPVSTLAAQCGLSASMLYKFQCGSRLPDSVETLKRLLDLTACSLAQKDDLISAYQIECIGVRRYESFQIFKAMLGDMADIRPLVPTRDTHRTLEFPSTAVGINNVNAIVQSLLEQETHTSGGKIQMMVPLGYNYCFECLSQSLTDCVAEFQGVWHLFCLKATASDDALLYNMQEIRQVLPRMLTMARYHPMYGYLPDPDDGATPFPYFIITSAGVLLLGRDFLSAAFLRDPDVRAMFQTQFDTICRRFIPMMRRAGGEMGEYMLMFQDIMTRMDPDTLEPIVISSEPSIIACISPEATARYTPPELLQIPEMASARELLHARPLRYSTFFTPDGLEHLLETGVIAEMQGTGIPALEREDVLDALEELVRRSKAGTVAPYMFRQNLAQGRFRFCMGLYGKELFSICEMPEQQFVYSDMTESTLAHVVRAYSENALALGDVYSREETISILENTLRRYGRRGSNNFATFP